MIGGNDVDDTFIDGFNQGFPVAFRFNRGIPPDEISFGQVGRIVEPQVVHTGFPRNLFSGALTRIQQ